MVPSPFLTGIVPILFFLFIIVGVTYGITVKKITDTRSIGKYMGEAMRDMAGFIVLIFFLHRNLFLILNGPISVHGSLYQEQTFYNL